MQLSDNEFLSVSLLRFTACEKIAEISLGMRKFALEDPRKQNGDHDRPSDSRVVEFFGLRSPCVILNVRSREKRKERNGCIAVNIWRVYLFRKFSSFRNPSITVFHHRRARNFRSHDRLNGGERSRNVTGNIPIAHFKIPKILADISIDGRTTYAATRRIFDRFRVWGIHLARFRWQIRGSGF